MSSVDWAWIAEQMIQEGRRLSDPPSCFCCKREGPGLYWLPSEEGIIEMAVWFCGRCVVKSEAEDPQGHHASDDYLRAVVSAWDRWASDYDNAVAGEREMDAAVNAARDHLAPVLVDVDDASPVRCVP